MSSANAAAHDYRRSDDLGTVGSIDTTTADNISSHTEQVRLKSKLHMVTSDDAAASPPVSLQRRQPRKMNPQFCQLAPSRDRRTHKIPPPMRSKKSLRLTKPKRSKISASPDSVFTEGGYTSHEDSVEEAVFIDAGYYDEEDFELRGSPSTRQTGANKHHLRCLHPTTSASGLHLRKRKTVGSTVANNNPYGSGYSSAAQGFGYPAQTSSVRQIHQLKAELTRMRRKVTELIRQRRDIRAANELLLEQNARLRQLRMTEQGVAGAKRTEQQQEYQHSTMPPPPAPAKTIAAAHHPDHHYAALNQTLAVVVTKPLGGTVCGSAPTVVPSTASTQALVSAAPAIHTQPIYPATMAAVPGGAAITLSAHQPLHTVQLQPQGAASAAAAVVESPAVNFYQHHQVRQCFSSSLLSDECMFDIGSR